MDELRIFYSSLVRVSDLVDDHTIYERSYYVRKTG